MYKIAHISDPHVSYSDENGYGKRLVELLTDIKNKNCDHVIITGDIVDNPIRADLQYVKEIISHFGILESSRISVVPGNHDVFGGSPKGQDFFRFYMKCKETDYENNVDAFIETFKASFPSNHSFPYIKIINNIALIGVNSNFEWSMKKNREGSNGYLNDETIKKLKKILSSEEIKDKYKIILIHHYFSKPGHDEENYPEHSLWLRAINWKMKLYEKKKLLKLFKKYKINLILNGHSHVNQVYNLGGITIVNSSSCVMPLTDDLVRKYNIISIPAENEHDSNINIETITIGK